MEYEEKKFASPYCVEVRKMLENPVFKSDNFHFTFRGLSSLEDLRKRSLGYYVQDVRGDTELSKPRINFCALW